MTVSSQGRFIVGEELACGELGHMRVQLDGPLCICGLRGCLDAFCSGRTWPDVNERLGEAWQASIAERVQILGIGIGNLLKLVHSPLVILNGIYNDYQEIVRKPLAAAIAAELSPLGLSTPRLAFGARLEEKACIGAALRAIDQQMAGYLERIGTSKHEVRHTGTWGS
jgi:predicted NBD/HSP70 family sugar kinase